MQKLVYDIKNYISSETLYDIVNIFIKFKEIISDSVQCDIQVISFAIA
jgi:hypothetical protein